MVVINNSLQILEVLYSTKLWLDKTLVDSELQENWWRKFWWLITLIIVHYYNRTYNIWQIKLWQIANCLPNPSKFCPAKVLCCMVIHLYHIALLISDHMIHQPG